MKTRNQRAAQIMRETNALLTAAKEYAAQPLDYRAIQLAEQSERFVAMIDALRKSGKSK